MSDKKNKKKTLTISTNLTKKIDISSMSRDGKKTFSIDKKYEIILPIKIGVVRPMGK